MCRARHIPPLRADQRAIAEHPARFKVVACGRRWGKTMLGLVMAAYHAMHGASVWWVAPTYGMAFHPWRTFKRRLAPLWVQKIESERHIDLQSGGSITVKSADDPDTLRGVGLDFVVIDEAAFMLEEAWVACLRPALSDRKGSALIISTPRGHNWFYDAYQRGQDPIFSDWWSWQYPTSANLRIDAQEIEEARALLPERVFRQEYQAEFLPGGGEVFQRVRESATAPANMQPIPGHVYVMGVDFGRHQDFTALAVLDETARTMVALDRFGGVDWTMQRARIASLARAWHVDRILAESNAMGEPNIDALWREGLPISGFVTTAASKAGLINGLIKAIESAELAILPDPVLIGELESYRYELIPYTGLSRFAAPPGQHDDTVIALALAWSLLTMPRPVFGILEADNPGWL